MKPSKAGVIDVGDVVAEAGLLAVVVDDGEELVGPLLGVVLVLAVVGQDLLGDLQVDGEVDVLQELLTTGGGRFVVDEAFDV